MRAYIQMFKKKFEQVFNADFDKRISDREIILFASISFNNTFFTNDMGNNVKHVI